MDESSAGSLKHGIGSTMVEHTLKLYEGLMVLSEEFGMFNVVIRIPAEPRNVTI